MIPHSQNEPPDLQISLISRLTWSELYGLETDETPMLWEGFLPRREIALLAGIGGYGKSTLVRQLAVAIVRGEDEFLTARLHPLHRRVIYVSCEDGPQKTARIMRGLDDVHDNKLVFLFASQFSLQEVLDMMAEEMAQGPVDLIVIDSLGNLFKGEQNSNSSAQEFYKHFAWFSERTCVLFLHHIRKGDHRSAPDQVSVQGAGAFVQRARAVIMLTGNKHST